MSFTVQPGSEASTSQLQRSISPSVGACRSRQHSKDSFETVSLSDSSEDLSLKEISADQRDVFLRIYRLLSVHTSFVSLMGHKGELEELGKEVEHIPPSLFLDLLRENTQLQAYFEIVEHHSHSWSGLLKRFSPWHRTVSDFSKKIILELREQPQVWGLFLDKLDVKEREDVLKYIHDQHFEDLLKYFFSPARKEERSR